MSRLAKLFALSLPFAGLLLGATNANALACTSVATGNWGVAGTWTSAGNCNRVPTAADTVTIATGHTVTVNVATANVLSVTVNTGAILTQSSALNSAGVLSVLGTLNSTNTMAIGGATTVTGALNITATTGTRTLTGLVTVNAGGVWNNSINEPVTFRGGITNNGTFTAGTGTQTFNLAQAIGGANPINFGGIVAVVGAVTVTNNNTNIVTIAGNLTGSVAGSTWVNAANSTLNYGGALAPMATGVLNAAAVPNTVNYNGGAAQAVKTANYNNLTVTKAAGIATTAAGTVNVTGALTVTSGTLNIAGTTVAVTGATSVSGTLGITNATGTKTFTGLVTVNPGGTWTNATEAVTLRGGLTHNGATFTAGTGIYTFDTTAAQSVSCAVALTIPSVTVTAPTVLTNNCNLTVSTALGGTGTLTNAATGILNIGGTSAITTLNAATAGNVVNYTGGAAQTIKATTYDTLNTSGAGAKSTVAAAVVTVNNTLSVTGGAMTNNGTLTVTTALSGTGTLINAGTRTLNIGGTSTITILTATAAGNIVNYTGVAQTIKPTSYATLNVTGTATNSGTVTVATALGGAGTLTNAATGILNIGGTSLITGLDAITAGNVVNYTGGAAQAIKATTYDTLNTSGAGAKSTVAAAVVTVNNTLSVTGGAMTNNGTLTVTTALSGTGTLINAGTRTLNIGGTSTITILTATAAGNIVNYTGVAQTIKPTSYAMLNVTGTATNSGTVTVATALGGTGTLTNAATGILNIGGTSAISALNAATAGNVVNYTGAAAQTIKATTYATLNFSGAGVKTNTGIVTVNTALTGTALTNAAAGTLNIGGTSTITTLTATAAGNTVNYTGAAQTVKATTYHHLGLGGSGAKAIGATAINGNFTMSGTATTAPTGALTVGGNFSIGATNTFANGANALNVAGNFAQDGTFTAGAGVVTLNGGAAVQTISGTGPLGFANLTVSNAGITLARDVTVASAIIGAVTLTSTCPTDYTLTSNGGATVAHSCFASVVSINRADADPTSAASVSWTVTFNRSVSGVSSGNFALVNAGLGGTPAITLVSGGGTTWTVTASTGSGDGTLGLNMANSAGVSPAITGLPSTGQVYTLDRTAPFVSSIMRADPNPTSQTSVSWTVTFSESVTGVDTTDFALVPTGAVSGATITLASGSGATWTVSANTGSGSGTLGLNLVDNDSIVDATSNPLGGAGAGNGNFTGEIYTVNAAPTFQAAGTAVGGAATVSPAWPPHAINDLALLFIESAGGEAATLSVPAGFAPVLNSPQATGATTAGTRITVFWARATSAAMTAPTVADPGNHVYAQIITYRGVINTGDPWDVTGGGVKAVVSAAVTVTGVTTTVPGTLIVQAVARDTDSAAAAFSAQTNANLAGIAERSDAGTALGTGGGFAVWDGVKAAAGATGNTTATVTSSINAFLTIALKPVPTVPVADHFSVNHSGTGVTCQAEPITVAAHDASHNIFTSQATSITLSTSTGLGDWSLLSGGGTLTPGAVDSGSAVYAFVAGDNGQVTLGLKHTTAASVSLGVTDGTATLVTGTGAGETDPPVVYSDAGFSVTDSAGNPVNIGSQVAGQTFGALYLQAVKTAPNGACTGVFNTTVNIEMASQCNNPAACAGKQVTVDATALNVGYSNSTVPGGSGLAGVNVPLAFGANSIASFMLNYPDVGQIKLYARYNMPLRDGSGSGNYMVGNSNPFVVKPGGFALYGIMRTSDSFANPAAADATGARFVRAGEAFTATVTATTCSPASATCTVPGAATPNYGKETPAEGVRFVDASLPSTDTNYANHGTLVAGLGLANNPAIGGTFGAFTNSVATGTAFTWNEVGIITLTPSVADADYLGAGDVAGTTSGNVGRFYAAQFALSGGIIANRTGLGGVCSAPVGCDTFTYMGEQMSAMFTLTAQAVDGTQLQNYNWSATPANQFAKLNPMAAVAPGTGGPLGMGAVDSAATRTPFLPCGVAMAHPCLTPAQATAGAFASGVANVAAPLTFYRGNAAVGPYASLDIGVAPVDSDGAALTYNLDTVNLVAGTPNHTLVGQTRARYGRMKLSNAHGSELLKLAVPMEAQFWQGQYWAQNSLDDTTAIALGNIKSSNAAVTISGVSKDAAGRWHIVLNKPMTPASTNICLDLDTGATGDTSCQAATPLSIPYLQTGAAFDKDPVSRATFGVYKGNNEFIYLREAY